MNDMSKILKGVLAAAVASGFLLLSAPSAAEAQALDHRWDVSIGAGPSFATGDLARLPFGDLAPTAGLDITYWLTPRIGVQVNGDWEKLLSDDQQIDAGPDLNLIHYTVGAAVNVLEPANPLSVRASVAGGGTTMDSDTFLADGMLTELSETYFSANGGVRVGYDVTSQVSVFADGNAHVVFTDEQDTALLASLDEDAQPFDQAWTFPTRLGFEVSF